MNVIILVLYFDIIQSAVLVLWNYLDTKRGIVSVHCPPFSEEQHSCARGVKSFGLSLVFGGNPGYGDFAGHMTGCAC